MQYTNAMSDNSILLGIGNIYVETNFLDINTAGSNTLVIGKEYRSASYETRLGGSVTNFVLQAKALGARVGIIGKIGVDEYGEKLKSLLSASGISTDFIVSSPTVTTCIDSGLVLHHNHQNIQVISGNANQMLSKTDIPVSDTMFDAVSAIYLGGFLKQENLYREYPELLRSFKKRNIKIFLDHGRIPVDVSTDKRNILFESLSLCDGYFPNEEEILGITQTRSLDTALDIVLSKGVKFVAVKMGEKGCRVKSTTVDRTIAAKKVSVISTVGAGDAFNAGFITQYLKGIDLGTCLAFANTTAALRISSFGYPLYNQVEENIQ